jgi:uncharacterized iron-regulated membrane protein
MSDTTNPAATDLVKGGDPTTRRSQLSRILEERPEARSRLGHAVAALLGTFLVAVAVFGGLWIWHIRRRARLIRERLNAPRVVRLPDLPGHEVDPTS